MRAKSSVELNDTIDQRPIGAFQVGVFVLCAACLLMDGFDLQAMGFTAPAVIKDWGIAAPVLGPVLSAALVGVLIGSLGFSMLADRFGRRPVLIGAAFMFAVFTLGTSRVSGVNELLVMRLFAGMGLGGIMPNVVALVSEYSPARLRATLIMNVSNGLNAGAAFGGFVAAWMIPNFGWRSVFVVGGVIPLIVGAVMIFRLPESGQFLAVRREGPKKGLPIALLFSDGRGAGTVLLWVTNFMNLLNLYFLSSWLPTLVTGLGYSTREAVLVGTMLQVGGMIGGVMLGVVRRSIWVCWDAGRLLCAGVFKCRADWLAGATFDGDWWSRVFGGDRDFGRAGGD